jgi:membrane-bound lytic murein transglycosylase D
MQLILHIQKIIILSVLTCSLFIAWLGGNIQLPLPPPVYNTDTDKYTDDAMPQDSIWSSISHDLKLDHQTQSSRVQAEIHKILADQGKLLQILKAAAPYIYFIHEETKARGLPAELALIPIIESEFNPNDHSKKGATGLWQLMPQTASELGIKVKSSYDGRRNVVASTKAALAYFNDLGNLFKGDWYLAIAAYNCGQVKVASTEKRTGVHNFWNLPLPKETKYYVPKLLAVAAIIKNPEKYGVQLPNTSNEPYFAQLKVKNSVNLAEVAKSSGISFATLDTLNPDNRDGKIPVIKDNYAMVLVPINKAHAVQAQFTNSLIFS